MDSIDKAIAAADEPTPPAYVRITTSSGRQVVVAMPKDISEDELFDLVTFLSSEHMRQIARNNAKSAGERATEAARKRILVPS